MTKRSRRRAMRKAMLVRFFDRFGLFDSPHGRVTYHDLSA